MPIGRQPRFGAAREREVRESQGERAPAPASRLMPAALEFSRKFGQAITPVHACLRN